MPESAKSFVARTPIKLRVVALAGCGFPPRRVALSSSELRPLLAAMDASPRLQLGFSPVRSDSDIRLEGAARHYDAMLHVQGKTSRRIAFRKKPGGYVWVGAQESYPGPRTRETPDGVPKEQLTLTCETEPISGTPPGRMHIVNADRTEA